MHAAGVPPETAELQARVANLEAEVAELTDQVTHLTEALTHLRRNFGQRIAYLEGRLLPFEEAKRQRERTELHEP
jgi:septal ring factor EnvC (AmiA/AmiB activator)